MFPLQIGINILLLALGKTKTFNADLWNVWGKIFTAVIVMGTTNSVVLAFVVASIQIVLELWSSDAHQKRLQKMSGIPGVTCSHRTLFFSCILWPFDMILRKIPFLNKEFGVAQLRDKIGIFAKTMCWVSSWAACSALLAGMTSSIFSSWDWLRARR